MNAWQVLYQLNYLIQVLTSLKKLPRTPRLNCSRPILFLGHKHLLISSLQESLVIHLTCLASYSSSEAVNSGEAKKPVCFAPPLMPRTERTLSELFAE